MQVKKPLSLGKQTLIDFYYSLAPLNISKAYFLALYAQAKHETGNFQSNLYENFNNVFGMKPAQSRKQNRTSTVTLGNETFAVFADDYSAFLDRIALDDYNGLERPQTVQDLPKYMAEVQSKGFATDANYLAKWENHLNGVFSDEDFQEFYATDYPHPMLGNVYDTVNGGDSVIYTDTIKKRFSVWWILLSLVSFTALCIFLYNTFIKKKKLNQNEKLDENVKSEENVKSKENEWIPPQLD